MNERRVSVADGKRRLTQLLRETEDTGTAVLIYRRDQLAGVLVPPDLYARISRLESYARAVALSDELAHLDINVPDLVAAARGELAGEE